MWTRLRTKAGKYIGHPTGDIELYHLEVDPNETENAASDEELSEVMNHFAKHLIQITCKGTFE